jgi:hypothetical protein
MQRIFKNLTFMVVSAKFGKTQLSLSTTTLYVSWLLFLAGARGSSLNTSKGISTDPWGFSLFLFFVFSSNHKSKAQEYKNGRRRCASLLCPKRLGILLE